MHRTPPFLPACLGILLCLSALGCAPEATTPLDQTYYVVTHGAAGHPFWSVVVRGARDAGQALGVQVQYLGPDQFSVAEFVSLLDAAIAARPAGIALSITDPVAVAEPLQRALAAGIPVVAINVADPEGTLPYLMYIGSDEYEAGKQAGERLLAEGFTGPAVCAIHEVGNLTHERRCQGFTDALEAGGKTVIILDITADTVTAVEVFRAHFSANPSTGAVLTLGPDGMSSWSAFRRDGEGVGVKHITFDLDPLTLDAIRDGDTQFTVDQQQYLQGFQSVMALYLKYNFEIVQANDVLTGPGFVDRSNIDRIATLIQAGTR